MPSYDDVLRMQLAAGPLTSRQLIEKLGVSQPTLSRALRALGDEVLRIGRARSIHYLLRDHVRGLPEMPVFRVDREGRIRKWGTLIPVRPEGFVMRQEDGVLLHSEGLPWWLYDMRPQGYLGRAYAARHGAALGLPARLTEWSDTHALRALLAHGQDAVGNLLLGELARDQFLSAPVAAAVAIEQKPEAYARLAQQAASGEQPGSSAGGEQPKLTARAMTPDGPCDVIVKFSEREAGPVSERWRDLLLAEHLALTTLREAGIPAAKTQIVDHDGQRFLESVRFDRVGERGRRALLSLSALDAEFVGIGSGDWPVITRSLAAGGHIASQAAEGSALLWAFGTLIGNTDMHNGNLSFLSDSERPYLLAPAYDMSPMAFAPRSGGGLPDGLPEARLHAAISNETWRQAQFLAHAYLAKLSATPAFSQRFTPCLSALNRHIANADDRIARLG